MPFALRALPDNCSRVVYKWVVCASVPQSNFAATISRIFAVLRGSARTCRKLPVSIMITRPHTKDKTPPIPKIHFETHPQSTSKTEIQKKYEKYTKIGQFRIFFVVFSVFLFWRQISKCSLWVGGVLYFVWGHMIATLAIYPLKDARICQNYPS